MIHEEILAYLPIPVPGPIHVISCYLLRIKLSWGKEAKDEQLWCKEDRRANQQNGQVLRTLGRYNSSFHLPR